MRGTNRQKARGAQSCERRSSAGAIAADPQRDLIAGFFSALWPDGIPDDAELVLFDRRSTAWRRVASIDEAATLVASGEYGCFGCALMRRGQGHRGSACDAAAIPGLWAEIDVLGGAHAETKLPSLEQALEFVARLPLKPTLVLYSGGGLHLWWLFREPWVFDNDADRLRAKALLVTWQQFILDLALRKSWRLDDTSSLASLLRPEGARNDKYSPPRFVRRIGITGPRWNPSDFEEWHAPLSLVLHRGRATQAQWELPRTLPESIAIAIRGLEVATSEVREGDALKAVVLELCPTCAGVQRTTPGLARYTAHVAPVTGALRCKRQSCEAHDTGLGGGMRFEAWVSRFLAPELSREVQGIRAQELGTSDIVPCESQVLDGREEPVALAEAGPRLDALIQRAADATLARPVIALVTVTTGAGKTRAVVRRLAERPSAYFARSHALLDEVASALRHAGVPFMHVKGIGEACKYKAAFKLYDSPKTWRSTACVGCPQRTDATCEAWRAMAPEVALLAPHDSLPTLRGNADPLPSAPRRASPLDGRLVFVDEAVRTLDCKRLTSDLLLAPLRDSSPYGGFAADIHGVSLLLQATLLHAQRIRAESQYGEHPTRYSAEELGSLWASGTSAFTADEKLRLVRAAASIRTDEIVKPDGASLRAGLIDRTRLPHPNLQSAWGALVGVAGETESERASAQRTHGVMTIVVSDEAAHMELRTPLPIALGEHTGVVLLDATGDLTRAELEAANPGRDIELFTLDIAPSPEARISRFHVLSKNATRRQLLVGDSLSDRASGMLKTTLKRVRELSAAHVRRVPARWSVITHRPVAHALAHDAELRRAAIPDGVQLEADQIGYYGCDDRGSNRFSDTDVLITFGDPIENIGSTTSDAGALGVESDALITTRAKATLAQAHGRARALRAPGAKVIVHVGSIRPDGWTESSVALPNRGRPPSALSVTVARLVQERLAADDIVSAPLIAHLLRGLPGLMGSDTNANRESSEGTFVATASAQRAIHRAVRSAADAAGATSTEVPMPDSTWTVWARPSKPVDAVRARARDAWQAVREAIGTPSSTSTQRAVRVNDASDPAPQSPNERSASHD